MNDEHRLKQTLTPQEFIVHVLDEEIILDNLKHYRLILDQERALYQEDDLVIISRGMSRNDRDLLLKLAERIQIETISTLLGILDGSSHSTTNLGEFKLTFNNGENLTGDLQDFFIGQLQDEGRF